MFVWGTTLELCHIIATSMNLKALPVNKVFNNYILQIRSNTWRKG